MTTFQDNETHLYKIRGTDGVMGQQAWIKDLPDRFDDGLTNGILYRPEIVNEIIPMIKDNLSKPVAQGLMIKGPQGIGKSHSIVNVIQKLQSTGNYLVTFIPNCENWYTSNDLIEAICSSFGSKYENLDLHYFKEKNYEKDFPNFINAVDNVLTSEKKQYEIYLVYLSPNEACSMRTKISEYSGDSGNQILIQYITLSSVDCLESLEKFISI